MRAGAQQATFAVYHSRKKKYTHTHRYMYNIFFQKNKNNAALPHTQTQAALDNR